MNFDTEEILNNLGFGSGNEAQIAVDKQVLIVCEPYVPFDAASIYPTPGKLKASGGENTILGSGNVIYRAPYARYLYYHPEFSYQEAPMRGAYWADRAMQDGGKEKVVKALKSDIKKRIRR